VHWWKIEVFKPITIKTIVPFVIIFVGVTPELGKSKDNSKEIEDATENLRKQLVIEKTLKTQAVNKLAEIMCRKDFMLLQRENSKKRKATSDDLRKKEKECRKLHQELGAVSWTIGSTVHELGHFRVTLCLCV